MTTVACRRPASCGVKTHRSGTSAAAACAFDASRPNVAALASLVAPIRPKRTYGTIVRHRELDQRDPTGGYDQVATTFHGRGETKVDYRQGREIIDGGGMRFHRSHREDGPATLNFAPDGTLMEWAWKRDAVVHREAGPARWYAAGGRQQYVLDGTAVGDVAADGDYLDDLVAAGADPATVVRWLRIADRDIAGDLVAAGIKIGAYEAAVAAGVSDERAAADVALGVLPISWAAAGS